MRFGRFGSRLGRRQDAQLDLLRLAQKIAPIAVFIPIGAVEFERMLDALRAVAALQIGGGTIFVAAPADAIGVFGENRKFFGHKCGFAIDFCCTLRLYSLVNNITFPRLGRFCANLKISFYYKLLSLQKKTVI